MNNLESFQTSMTRAGLCCSKPVVADGKLHRFKNQGDEHPNSWYVLFNGDLLAGAYGCWKLDISQKWCSKSLNRLSEEEQKHYREKIQAVKAIQEKERAKYYAEAKTRARQIWDDCKKPQPNHPYFVKKGIKPYGIKQRGNELVIPLKNNEIQSLQFILPDGNKRFMKGGSTKGAFFTIGEISETIYIAEGYATAATIHEATNCCVIVAFSAENLLRVAEAIRKEYPDKKIVVCADNDAFTSIGNIGVQKATEAAQSIKAKLIVPQFKNIESKPTDFNDLMLLEGWDEVRNQLSNVEEVKSEANDESDKRPSQATLLIDLTKDLELFHDKQNNAYATLDINGHKETWRLDSLDFQYWLNSCFWKAYQKAINKNALQDALGALRGKACFDGVCQEVYTRVAVVEGATYINLANQNWEIIKVTKNGWAVLKDAPVKFIRTANMQSLPIPIKGGHFNRLWKFINVPEKYQKLVLAFILECFRPNTPFPILVLSGIQGSAKSTTQEIIRTLIDPSACNLRTAPKKVEDLLVAAVNSWVVSFNNVSYLSDGQQDDLCSVATGGALGTRELYTTHQEACINVKRPVIINGIGDLVTAPDLLDRCLVLELPEIEAKDRKTEAEITLACNEEFPAIFGSLLDILSGTLKEIPNTKLDDKPRMADFAVLGAALEKVMGWNQGSFQTDYNQNRNDNMVSAMEHSPVAVAITRFIDQTYAYSGSYNNLYARLNEKYKPEMVGWPKSPKGLANQMRRQKQALLAVGIEVTLDNNRHMDGYHIHIKKVENKVHNVHEVHEPTPNKALEHELTHEHTNTSSLSSLQVHAQNPHQHYVDELHELDELQNQPFNVESRERAAV